jgi:ATP-dependent DNA helicase DinG
MPPALGHRPITSYRARELLDAGSAASRAIPGYQPREGQIRMAEAVLTRLEEGGHAAIEAPTGIGKTLAYLVPAVISGRRIVISTHTKTLQDQIIEKDLVLLGKILAEVGLELVRASASDPEERPPGQIRYALMKGRSNYLCLDRLEKKGRQTRFAFENNGHDLYEELSSWSRTTQRGDRSELVGLNERAPIWDELDARSEICHGMRCASYDSCFVTRMRREAALAQIVVVNHHLLLADLALKAQASLQKDGRSFGVVIPECDALILDEAHGLEETASEYFGGQISAKKLERFAMDATASSVAISGAKASALLAKAIGRAEGVFEALPRRDGRVVIGQDAPDDPFRAARSEAKEACAALLDLASAWEAGPDEPALIGFARRARDLAENLGFVLSAADPDYVYFAERSGKTAVLGASPIDVAELLGRFLFEAYGAVVLTSATLATGAGKLDYFLKAIGAPAGTEGLVLDSPFDYPRQAAIYLPSDAPEPDGPGAIEGLVKQGKALIDLVGGGAMFLFTSHRVMQAVHAQLRPQLAYPVLIQGERPKGELLRVFVEKAPAVLFGTASFWEGVDIPGDPLRLVLIDRLPFDSPNDPLGQARGARLEALGKSPFNSYHLPRAILRLKQGFGRLVRGPSDRGIVALLDKRIQTKPYGQRFLHALPAARRIHHFDDLKAWLASVE